MNLLLILLPAALLSIQPAAVAAEYKKSGSIREILPPDYQKSGKIREILAEPDAEMEKTSAAAGAEPDPPQQPKPSAVDAESGPDKTKFSDHFNPDLKLAVKTLAGNIRKEPGLEAEVIEILFRGDLVSLIDRQGEWLSVRLHDGKTGWAHRNLFSTPKSEVLQTGETEWLLTKIRILVYSQDEARVLIDLSGFPSPDAFTVPSASPAVVCDFPHTRCVDGLTIPTPPEDGFIRQVAVRKNGSSTRMIVFLSDKHGYDIQQIFFSAESVYALIFKKEKS